MKWISAMCLTVLSTGWQAANAACNPVVGTEMTCTGSTATQITNTSNPPLTNAVSRVTLDSGYSVDLAANNAAFQIINDQAFDLNFTQAAGGVAKSTFGIAIVSAGGVSQLLQGSIAGKEQSGFSSVIRNGGNSLVINQAASSTISGWPGIVTQNDGKGSTDITVAGSVASLSASGISGLPKPPGNALGITNGSTAVDLTVTQSGGSISGSGGIVARNNGSGTTSISTSGTVTATNAGLGITNGANAKDLKITQNGGEISGAGVGVTSDNQGAGSTVVNTVASVKSANGPAFGITNGVKAKGLMITQSASGTIDAAAGISTQNNGVGETKIETLGAIKANNGPGITTANDAKDAISLTVAQTAGSITSTSASISTRNTSGGDTVITTTTTLLSTAGVGINAE